MPRYALCCLQVFSNGRLVCASNLQSNNHFHNKFINSSLFDLFGDIKIVYAFYAKSLHIKQNNKAYSD